MPDNSTVYNDGIISCDAKKKTNKKTNKQTEKKKTQTIRKKKTEERKFWANSLAVVLIFMVGKLILLCHLQLNFVASI